MCCSAPQCWVLPLQARWCVHGLYVLHRQRPRWSKFCFYLFSHFSLNKIGWGRLFAFQYICVFNILYVTNLMTWVAEQCTSWPGLGRVEWQPCIRAGINNRFWDGMDLSTPCFGGKKKKAERIKKITYLNVWRKNGTSLQCCSPVWRFCVRSIPPDCLRFSKLITLHITIQTLL